MPQIVGKAENLEDTSTKNTLNGEETVLLKK